MAARKATARKTSGRAKQKRTSTRSASTRRGTTTRGRSAKAKTAGRTRRATQTRGRSAGASGDAINLLKKDHDAVKKLFAQFEKQHSKMKAAQKAQLVEKICHELTVHATIEEEIFYPRIRSEVSDAEELLDEAQVEHQSAKDLIAALENGSPEDGIYDAQVTVLSEYIKHHVKEEEGQLFPMVKRSKQVDLVDLGSEMKQRKMQLL